MSVCLGCSGIETKPVTLITGETVCSYCPAWKQECLDRDNKAKELMGMELVPRRAAFRAYRDAHGQVAADRLLMVMHRDN